ncbi:TetR/AcrR family transcriptional regulator [Brevibacterium album]|uniref:TetR/AcrR family transcriptional regulator n=1 Tax=Brevibacterium album TaxID=417948 RepID=UPI0004256566|nr:TetR/AcrR family transcriptional regulator C-terminal domain-containing protein [Brevibacterium album]
MTSRSTDARRRQPLSRERVVEAALAIIDADGVEALTMRRLGKELRVDPMMVYRHFPSKVSVLDGVMSRIWASVELGELGDESWQEALAATMHGLRRALLRHPRAVSILGTRPAAGPELFALLEQILARLAGLGMPVDGGSAELLNAVVNYTVGHVLAEGGDPVGGETGRDGFELSDLSALPTLAKVFGSGWRYSPERQFDRALRGMIRGWRAGPESAEPERQ